MSFTYLGGKKHYGRKCKMLMFRTKCVSANNIIKYEAWNRCHITHVVTYSYII